MSWTRESKLFARCGAAAIFAAIVAQGPLAFAQSTAGDAATAETLFNEGKRLSDSGDYAAACPKLAESYRLDPGGGTLTALAVCHESQGKTASAWAEFIQVASDARQAHRADREKFAKQRIAALEPKLSKLTVMVDPSAAGISGLEVRRDDVVLGKPTWGTAIPVDPGDHTIEARAKGKETWSTHVKLGDSADAQNVTVPALDDAPAAPSAPETSTPDKDKSDESKPTSEAPASDASTGSSQRVVGLVVGGAGLALAAVGAGFGASALSNASSANQSCPNSTCDIQAGLNAENSAKSAALISDVMFGGAIVAVGVGLVLYLTAPHASQSASPPATESFFSPLTFVRGGAGYTVRW
jgi:hypothetical protein